MISDLFGVCFFESHHVKYTNMPEELKTSEPVLERLAHNNSLTLSIQKTPETAYLPRNDFYVVTAEKFNRNMELTSLARVSLITEKTEPLDTILKKLNEKAAVAVLKVQEKFTKTNSALDKTTQTIGQKIKGFFKHLPKK